MEVVNRGMSPGITPRRVHGRVGRNFIYAAVAARGVARFVITSDRKAKRTVSLRNFRISSCFFRDSETSRDSVKPLSRTLRKTWK